MLSKSGKIVQFFKSFEKKMHVEQLLLPQKQKSIDFFSTLFLLKKKKSIHVDFF